MMSNSSTQHHTASSNIGPAHLSICLCPSHTDAMCPLHQVWHTCSCLCFFVTELPLHGSSYSIPVLHPNNPGSPLSFQLKRQFLREALWDRSWHISCLYCRCGQPWPKTLPQLVQTTAPHFLPTHSYLFSSLWHSTLSPVQCRGTGALCISRSVQPSPWKGMAGSRRWKLRTLAPSKQRAASFLSSLETNLFVILSQDWDDTYDIKQSKNYL